jgi:hypothetical protein
MSGSVDAMYWFYVIGLVIAVSMGAYAAYWSIRLGRALKVRAYSRQALIVGLFSVYGTILFFTFYYTYFFVPSLLSTPMGTVQRGLYALLPPVAFAWIDSSIRVGRRTDPLLRDPLRWSKTRQVLWPLLLLSLLVFFMGPEGLLSFIIVGVSVIPVLKAAEWSGDRYYRRSLEWFGAAIVVLVVQNVGFNTLVPGLGTGVVYSPMGLVWSIFANFALVPIMFYAIYKCARSLVPINRISA